MKKVARVILVTALILAGQLTLQNPRAQQPAADSGDTSINAAERTAILESE